ncbi:hypothetical protein A7X85_06450 [Streptomyces sp. ST1015]|nr:hypothetical protein A7X85_06450 [Streptomyces sp. ST1015]
MKPINSRGLHPRRRKIHTMSITVEPLTERSAAEVNEEIRALWLRSGGILRGDQREEYQRLVTEWAAVSHRPDRVA